MFRALCARNVRPALFTRHFAVVVQQAPPRKPRAADAPSLPPGSLCYDVVFRRALGTRDLSEVILEDLLGAWRAAVTGSSSSVATQVQLIDTGVKAGEGAHEKGSLAVDVRFTDAESNYIVEIQHRTEALFPHRALTYAAAEIVGQPCRRGVGLRPVHVLAFCDFAFGAPKAGSGLLVGTALSASRWRRSDTASEHLRDPALAIHAFGLLPVPHAVGSALEDQRGDPHLARDMRARLSFLFALLPHAPMLCEVNASTPPILKWAALIAHLHVDNLAAVPREPGIFTPGVARLVDVLASSADHTRAEVRAADEEASIAFQHAESMADEAWAEGEAKGKAEGIAEGKAEGEAKGKVMVR